MAAIYIAPLVEFLRADPEQLLGALASGLAKEGFDSTTLTVFSWNQEIAELQVAMGRLTLSMPDAASWTILLEYVIPIVGQRIDCVLLARDVIFVVEYKGGHSATGNAALRQAQQYALNLTDFHEASRGHAIVALAVGAFRLGTALDLTARFPGAAVSPAGLPEAIADSFRLRGGQAAGIEPRAWNHSRYFPVPTIIEAATAVFSKHGVKNLAYSRSGIGNLEATQSAVSSAVRDAIDRGVRKLVVVTGVPGAGKTLAGLNVVQALQAELDVEHEQASFLSGNGPLVKILQEALKRSVERRKKGVARSVETRIRDMHRFVRDTYGDTRPPADRLIVFDEAQRAWTAVKNRKKFGRDVSEPEMVLEIMARHSGWSVVVALVGGGQEIHGGEAGLAAWGDAITRHKDWDVLASPEALHGGPSVAGSRLFRGAPPEGAAVVEEKLLHLAISKRSFETEITASWVNAVLDGRRADAAGLAASGLPIFVTRDLCQVRRWLRDNAKGERRSGLIASSGAVRLRAEGVEPPTFNFLEGIDYTKWFLEPPGDHRSSNQLEVALSEFEMQGLEIDLAGLLWGGDLIFPDGRVVARRLKGRMWVEVGGTGDPQASADDPRTRIQNKYRVLLTRFRKGMVIFVPQGSSDDPTRDPVEFDGVHDYLIRCGVSPLPAAT